MSTLSDIALVVKRSTKEDQNLAQCIHGSGSETLVTFYQWSEHLSKYICTIPNILSYHNFRVTCEQPGVAYLLEFSDSTEAQFNILKTNVDIEELSILPSKTHIPRLDLQHQCTCMNKYGHISSPDLTCPEPTMPKPSHNGTAECTPEEGSIEKTYM